MQVKRCVHRKVDDRRWSIEGQLRRTELTFGECSHKSGLLFSSGLNATDVAVIVKLYPQD